MTLNEVFSLPRFFNLLKEETSSGHRMTLIITSVIFVFLSFIFILNGSDHGTPEFHEVWYAIVLLAGGFYFTSTSFDELNRKEERMNYLAVPASIFEKFSMKLLITTLGYLIGLTLIYWLFSELINLITLKYFDFQFDTFNPFEDHYPLLIKIYLVVQSIFILGAATFNRFSFFKTLFVLGLIGLILGIFSGICFRLIFADLFQGFFIPKDNIRVMPSIQFRDFMEYTVWPLLQNLFWYVLAPVLWVIAYFKLKEREV